MIFASHLRRHSREGGNPSPDLEGQELDSRLQPPAEVYPERLPCRQSKGGNDESGFTLIELMVVIVIIGLLATIVIINVLPSQDRAMVQKAKADIALMEQGLELYRLNNLAYPSTGDGLTALVTPPATLADPSRYQPGGYIKKLPKDPWGRDYIYAYPGQHGPFDISTLGADGAPGGTGENADIGNWQ